MKTTQKFLISAARLVNEGQVSFADVFIADGRIEKILPSAGIRQDILTIDGYEVIHSCGKYLLPGIIDDQVHFREPGLTHKGNIFSESRAAVAGGVTSFMDMPNTLPKATTLALVEDKFKIAAATSAANFSFFLGATNDNLEEIIQADPARICGLKVFLGASTGEMLVDNEESLEKIFSCSPLLIAIHSEDEKIIRANLEKYKLIYGDDIPIEAHPAIRNSDACVASTVKAIGLARKHNSRLHVLHLSTAKETELLDNKISLSEKKITAEVCVHHLWFSEADYSKYGSLIKWNPAIKTPADRDGLMKALVNGKIDIVATDHAPHTLEEKRQPYLKCPSGGPLVQHSLPVMLELSHQGKISLEQVVEKMCHNPAILYRIKDRGFMREGYFADLVMVDMNAPWTVEKSNILYHCKWSPFEGTTFQSRITNTFVNGNLVWKEGKIIESAPGSRLEFNYPN